MVAVAATAVVGVSRHLWSRRGAPKQLAEARQLKRAARSRTRADATNADLVATVMKRAQVLGIDVPVTVTARDSWSGGYVSVTFHPSGETSHYTENFASLQRDTSPSGSMPPLRTFLSRNPHKALSSWSRDELREWLQATRDRIPPTTG